MFYPQNLRRFWRARIKRQALTSSSREGRDLPIKKTSAL